MTDARLLAGEAARRLLAALDARSTPLRVVEAAGGLACLVLVWPADEPMPTVASEGKTRAVAARAGCRADVLGVLRTAGRPLTRKQVVTAVRTAGHRHGTHTVWKALADLTASGDLVNPRDHRGYRLPGWERPRLGLFDPSPAS